jgi:NADH-quinone oxidoreductase subunit J
MMVIVFMYLFGIIAILSALAMIFHRNPVYSALFLVATFFSLAGIYAMLGAQFLSIIQVMVYAGAIMVLFLFVIMLLNLRNEIRLPIGRPFQVIFGVLFGIFLFIEGYLVLKAGSISGTMGAFPQSRVDQIGSVEALGTLLFTKYLLPFELASVLLLVGMVGAIILGRKKMPNEA